VIVIWSDEAIDDLASLRAYISKDSPLSARRVASMIVDSVEALLPANPKIGRPGRISGTRELVIPHTPYIVPYRLRDGAVNILRVYHGARRWPP
jgi:toxin ParE1/3/4